MVLVQLVEGQLLVLYPWHCFADAKMIYHV